MRLKTLQVLWHETEARLSVDFDPATGLLASCGTDKEIKLWRVGEDASGNPDVTRSPTLAGAHQDGDRRFSPAWAPLASGGDAGAWRSCASAPSDKQVTRPSRDVVASPPRRAPRATRTTAGPRVVAAHRRRHRLRGQRGACVGRAQGRGALDCRGHTPYVQGAWPGPARRRRARFAEDGDRTRGRLRPPLGMGADAQMLLRAATVVRTCGVPEGAQVRDSVPAESETRARARSKGRGDVKNAPKGPRARETRRARLCSTTTPCGSFFRRPAPSPRAAFCFRAARAHLPRPPDRRRAGARAALRWCEYETTRSCAGTRSYGRRRRQRFPRAAKSADATRPCRAPEIAKSAQCDAVPPSGTHEAGVTRAPEGPFFFPRRLAVIASRCG